MTRFLAIADDPGLSKEKFSDALDRIGKWRFSRRAWIVKAYCLSDPGRTVIECEAPNEEVFSEWLESNGWSGADIHRVDLIQEAGEIWPMRF